MLSIQKSKEDSTDYTIKIDANQYITYGVTAGIPFVLLIMACICYCLIRKRDPPEKKEKEIEVPKLKKSKLKD